MATNAPTPSKKEEPKKASASDVEGYDSADDAKVSEIQISHDEALRNSTMTGKSPHNEPAEAENASGGLVFVELLATSYMRHDYDKKKTKKYVRGDKFWITEAEFEKLTGGEFPPRVKETDEE